MSGETDKRERLIEVILTAVGIAAILGNLVLGELTAERILDATKDLVSFIVTIAVFVLGLQVYRSLSRKDFVGKFLEYLGDWASNNNFLVDEGSAEEDRGKLKNKRAYNMVVNPASILTATEPLGFMKTKPRTGAFVYIPPTTALEELAGGKAAEHEELTIGFRLNKSTFNAKQGQDDITEADVAVITRSLARRINELFGPSLNVRAVIAEDKDDTAKVQDKNFILVDISKVPPTEEAAKALVEMVDFVKTVVLALGRPSESFMSELRKASI